MRHHLKSMIVAVPMAFLIGCGDTETDAGDGDQPTPAATTATAAGVSEARAREIALDRVGGGEITNVSTHDEQNQPLWQVEVTKGGREYDVEINRSSGAVVGVDDPGGAPRDGSEPNGNENENEPNGNENEPNENENEPNENEPDENENEPDENEPDEN
ncbi:PepSY domain-containing protein [Actinoplanes sp. M2I2]|uniref:PepSY domain-containing protein n=1 Tax=Actinoplanes sp. M2I2 TaxID=1734444 RepID=UPI0020219E80|nr:PepSY domain-containing protein [Actinoplanes sp. M2I2]